MDDKRRYQRYAVKDDGEIISQGKIIVGGEAVELVDFSFGGLCVLSKKQLSLGTKRIVVEFKDRGNIELIGIVVRVSKEGRMWLVAIDLTDTYKLGSLRKV